MYCINFYLDPSKTIQYECIKIIYHLIKMEKTWMIKQNLANTLLNIWSNTQYRVCI